MLELLEPAVDEIVVTQNCSDRARAGRRAGGRPPWRSSAPDRVTVEPRLDDAIETAVRLAEDTGDDVLAGAGVLVTGSVVTAGEARVLLGGGRTVTDAAPSAGRRADDRRPAHAPDRRSRSPSGRGGPTGRPAARWPACSAWRRWWCCSSRAPSRSPTGLGPVAHGRSCIGLAVLLIAGGRRCCAGRGASRLGSALQMAFLATGIMIATMFLVGALVHRGLAAAAACCATSSSGRPAALRMLAG